MRFRLAITSLCLVLLFSACRKDSGGSQTRLVKDVLINNSGCQISYTYDSISRLVSVTQCDTIETYVYSYSTVTYKKVSAGILLYQNVYNLNKSGLAISYSRYGGDGSLATYLLQYNADGYLLSVIDTTHPYTSDYFTINNRDVIAEASTSSVTNDANYSITSIFYSNTKNTLSNENFGLIFLGKSSANFVKTLSYDSPTGQYAVTFTYLLDNQNGVSQRVSKTNGVVTDSRTYDYY